MMHIIKIHTLLIILLTPVFVSAQNVFVSTSGSNNNNGSHSAPYATVTKAISTHADTIFLLPGTYYENVLINNITRTKTNPLVITAAEKGTVLFEGVERFSYNWSETTPGSGIYVSDAPKDMWQLFVDGRMMINARWPNADHPFEDFDNSNWWDRHESWCKAVKEESGFEKQADGTKIGWLTEDGHQNMASTGIDFNGKVAVLNVNSMESYAGLIYDHTPGTNAFKYQLLQKVLDGLNDKEVGVVHKNRGHAYFFFENGLDLLDAPGEWYYNKDEKKIYVIPHDGTHPMHLEVAGKTQSYAFEVNNSEYVYIKGLNFFATTVAFTEIKFSKVEDCNFNYASYSKRILDDIDEIAHTKMVIETKPNKDNPELNPNTGNLFINNEVAYTDGMAFHMTRGIRDTIYNNYFHHIDISGTRGGSIGVDYRGGYYTAFIRNTFEKGGGSAATKSANFPYNALNRLSQWGYIQDDGVAFQVANGGQIGSISTQNWIHNSVKAGLRFDGPEDTDPWIKGVMVQGSFVRNVVWNNPLGYMVKGDDHRVYNNVAFNNSATGAKILASTQHDNGNTHTISRNNLMEDWSGERSGDQFTDPVPGIVDHNWLANPTENNIFKVLRDPYNLDFRPKSDLVIDQGIDIPAETFATTNAQIPDFTSEFKIGDAPDIGAYEAGADNYWIAGRMQPLASTPIPPNGTETAQVDADLMWLPAYKSTNNKVYLGTSESNLELVATQSNNIYEPGDLDPSQTYYWRVDCLTDNGWQTGHTWSFRPNGQAYIECGMPTSKSYTFPTPNGSEDYNSVPWKTGDEFLGEIHLLSDQLIIMQDAVANGTNVWNSNGMTAKAEIKIRDYPFVSFEYLTPKRSSDFTWSTQVVGAGNAKSARGASKVTLTPASTEYKNALINLTPMLDNWDSKYGASKEWIYLETLHFTLNADGDWMYARDGDFWLDNFKVGFAAIKDKVGKPNITGHKAMNIEKNTMHVITYNDLNIEVPYDGNNYPWPMCEDAPLDWRITIHPGDNYSYSEEVVTPHHNFEGQLYVSVSIEADGYESNQYTVIINVGDVDNSIFDNLETGNNYVFPNPVREIMFINSPQTIKTIYLYSVTGVVAMVKNAPTGQINVSDLSTGIYQVIGENKDGTRWIERISIL
ncbi:T9SS type A sorting domain-containing protein [Carboxylicivirga marina]|uniref:T9SS type A sorting domain-containing protein n=1 Tax=Carboxylicivirga marina TaxID=2800988 RepID=A0ABS1HPQ2_9BACT|nr:T9SS type A sorting domain-containing protein [Carboxylicivirga marina]MBK3519517.1 T9SS type A sorting domain-containing protein [Carboxylicivirga marina]